MATRSKKASALNAGTRAGRARTGALAKPIEIAVEKLVFEEGLAFATEPDVSSEDVKDAVWAGVTRARAEAFNKLEMLFVALGVQKTGDAAADYKQLAFALAQQYEPGFQFVFGDVARGGRRKVRHSLALMDLLLRVDNVRRRLDCTDGEALKELGLAETERPTKKNWLVEARDPRRNALLQRYRQVEDDPLALRDFEASITDLSRPERGLVGPFHGKSSLN